MFNRLCLIGVGLIGGSVALAAREQGLCRQIVAYGDEKHQTNLALAQQLGVIDEYYFDIGAALAGSDCVLIATPVGIGIAVFLSELCPERIRAPIVFVTELLAAIPSIVYGLWGIFVVIPAIRPACEWLHGHFGWIYAFCSQPCVRSTGD